MALSPRLLSISTAVLLASSAPSQSDPPVTPGDWWPNTLELATDYAGGLDVLREDLLAGGVAELHARVVRYDPPGPDLYYGWNFDSSLTNPDKRAWSVACTALCGEAMIRAPGWDSDPDRAPKIDGATAYLLALTIDDLSSQQEKDKAFALIFGLRYLRTVLNEGRYSTADPSLPSQIASKIQEYIDEIVTSLLPNASKSPGWYYSHEPATGAVAPCVTPARAVLALADAWHDGSYVIDDNAIHAGLFYVQAARIPSPTDDEVGIGIAYRYVGAGPIAYDPAIIESQKATPVGSAGRTPYCETALDVWGVNGVTPIDATEQFFNYYPWFMDGATPGQLGSEAGPFAIGPHFRMLCHWHTAIAVERLPVILRDQRRLDLLQSIYYYSQWISPSDPPGPYTAMFGGEASDTAMAMLCLLEGCGATVNCQSLPLADVTDLDEHTFIRGDVNNDATVDIADSVALLTFLFQDGPHPFLDAADVDDNGTLDLGDAILLLDHVLSSGPPPAAPYPGSGADPTPDALIW